MYQKTVILPLIFIWSQSILAQGHYQYEQPEKLQDGWQTNHLLETGADTSRIYELFRQLKHNTHEINSVLIIQNGELVVEEYFNSFSLNTPHDLRSATKSIRSLLMGIALEKGFVESIKDPISKYLKTHTPQRNMDSRKEEITIAHLMTMSSGFDCDDWNKKSKGQEDKVYKKRDWIQYTLNLPMINDPGTVSSYCSMGVVLLAEIISQSSGMSIDQFTEKYLFNPLGITNVIWSHTSDREVIPSGKRLYMTPRDLAKIGQLVLDNGSWNGKQVVPQSWIQDSTTPKTKITGIDYGFLWWIIPFVLDEKSITSVVATGNGGQYIFIIPELDLVAVFTGSAYNSHDDKLPFTIIREVFIKTFIAN